MKVKEIFKPIREKKETFTENHDATNTEFKYSMEELLSYYMEQSKILTEELAKTKAELVLTTKQLEEKDNKIQSFKEALQEAEKRIDQLEKENMRLTAIEEVWEKTFAKFTFVENLTENNGNLTDLEKQEEISTPYNFYNLNDFDCEFECEVDEVDYEE